MAGAAHVAHLLTLFGTFHSSGNVTAIDEDTSGEPQAPASVVGRGNRGGKRLRVTKRQMAEEVSFDTATLWL